LSGRSAYRRGDSKGCGKHKETEQISMITVHIRLPPGLEIRLTLLSSVSMRESSWEICPFADSRLGAVG
jgi:hypothetical protein